jgi:hypothetical protein
MIWWLTKGNHNLSIHPLVRKWLRLGALSKFSMTLMLFFFLLGAWGVAEAVRAWEWPGLLKFLMGLVWILWLAEVLVDGVATPNDMWGASPQPVLATRGEYIGGHPKLPHGRFVYLNLGGTRENPQLRVVLPQPGGQQALLFSIPLLDVQEASERRELANGELAMGRTMDNSLADVRFRSKGMGQQAFLNVNYTGAAGRKHVVEFGNFLFGDDEIQNWRNYIVCSQAEADTGEKPYGPWRSLPVENEVKEKQEGAEEKPIDPSPEEPARIEG